MTVASASHRAGSAARGLSTRGSGANPIGATIIWTGGPEEPVGESVMRIAITPSLNASARPFPTDSGELGRRIRLRGSAASRPPGGRRG